MTVAWVHQFRQDRAHVTAPQSDCLKLPLERPSGYTGNLSLGRCCLGLAIRCGADSQAGAVRARRFARAAHDRQAPGPLQAADGPGAHHDRGMARLLLGRDAGSEHAASIAQGPLHSRPAQAACSLPELHRRQRLPEQRLCGAVLSELVDPSDGHDGAGLCLQVSFAIKSELERFDPLLRYASGTAAPQY